MRSLLLAANWKMNPIPEGALSKDSPFHSSKTVACAVFATFLDLKACIEAGLPTGAQCGNPEAKGAHTGDISMEMLKRTGCGFVLCGHSERRRDHGESDASIAAQVRAALEAGLHPIVCVGETLDERSSGQEKNVVERQVTAFKDERDYTIAYEPVWAIGTGVNATAEQAQTMQAFIRSLLPEEKQNVTRILYGGSLKPENAAELLSSPDIDGGLIGGASLDPQSFQKLKNIAKGVKKN